VQGRIAERAPSTLVQEVIATREELGCTALLTVETHVAF
jgi:hypothetical protein